MPLVVKGKFTDADYALVEREKKVIWMCGVVKYENIFRDAPTHITTFCYLLKTDNEIGEFWRMAGPPEYNKTT
jgi:hypothetical protein